MNKTRFGKTELQVTPLGLGGAEIGFLKPERERAAKMLNLLLDEKVNVIDTAASYQTSEEFIGETIGHRRKEFVLISKCGNKIAGCDDADWSASLIAKSIDQSLRRLRTDVVDVMLLHTCDEPTLRRGEALGALVKARQAGKIRFAGFSGDNEIAAYAATLPEVAVVETSINLADQVNIDLVLPAARKHDVGVLAKRPVANAAWKNAKDQPGFYGGYAQRYHDRLAKMKLDPADLGFAGVPAELAWPELAIRFAISHPGVNTAIAGTASLENTARNIACTRKGALPADIVRKIRDTFNAAKGDENWPGMT
jgi:aryl-alcohol dehydrogenase-like predicted oxidoreductase